MRAELPVSLGNLIRTAVSVLLGVSVRLATVSVAVRLRLIDMLERGATGYRDHPRLEGGELSVGHVRQPSRDCFSREMQIHALCRPAVAAVQQLHRGIQAAAVGAGRTVDERLMAGLRLWKAA
jgi:hypothetical protein